MKDHPYYYVLLSEDGRTVATGIVRSWSWSQQMNYYGVDSEGRFEGPEMPIPLTITVGASTDPGKAVATGCQCGATKASGARKGDPSHSTWCPWRAP